MENPLRNNAPLSESQVTLLSRLLADGNKLEKSISYPELCGFLFGVASAPEAIAESEWLPLVFESSGPKSDAGEVPDVGLMRQLLASISQQASEGVVELPVACRPVAVTMDNLQPDVAFSQWCAGFMSVHDWLEDLWLEYTPDDLQDELTSMVMILSFFASDELAKGYYAELRDNQHCFEVVAEQVLALHSEAMVGYARLGNAILQAMAQIKSEPPPGQ